MIERVLLSLNVTAVLLLVVVVVAWGRHRGRRAIASIGLLGSVGVAIAYLSQVRAADIPIAWLTVLHYGSEETSIAHLYGRGAHVGANFPLVVALIAGAARITLHDVVRMNLGLALVNLVAFFCIATRVQSVWWAIPWTLVFACNVATFMASFSELPSNLLHLYFLAGVVGWVTLNDSEPQPRWVRAAAALLLGALTVLMASTRPEMGLTGCVALGVWAAHALLGDGGWATCTAHLRAALQRAVSFLGRHPAIVGLFCFAGWLISFGAFGIGCGSYGLRTGLSALYPINPTFLLGFFLLPAIGVPVAVAMAAFAGTAYAAFHFRRFGGLALAAVVTVNLYLAAPLGFYEVVRYTSYFIGIVLLLGLFGRAALDELSTRRAWPERWRAFAMVLYVMAWFTLPALGTLDPYLRPEYHASGGFPQLLLDRNTQREVRFLVAQTHNNPDCVFVARAIENHADPNRQPVWEYILFGAPIEQPIIVPERDLGLEATIARHAAGATCVRLYHGEDCNLTFTDRCREFVAGREIADEERFWSEPYNDPRGRGYAAPELVLATYRWR